MLPSKQLPSTSYLYLSICLLLFTAVTFVNKYVLSVLKFTYPTIFQGWQTFVGAFVIRILALSGKVELNTADISRSYITSQIPAMILFVVSIYSGSRALASLPIPTVMALVSLVDVIDCTFDMSVNKKNIDILNAVIIPTMLVSSVLVAYTDPKFQLESYGWMFLHVVTSGLKNIYLFTLDKLLLFFKKNIDNTVSEMGQTYTHYVFSVIVLAPCSYMLGDLFAAKDFQFLYFYKFYVGCILSGVLGVCLAVCAIDIKSSSQKDVDLPQWKNYTDIAKIITSAVSVLFFEANLVGANVLWIGVCLLGCCFLSSGGSKNSKMGYFRETFTKLTRCTESEDIQV